MLLDVCGRSNAKYEENQDILADDYLQKPYFLLFEIKAKVVLDSHISTQNKVTHLKIGHKVQDEDRNHKAKDEWNWLSVEGIIYFKIRSLKIGPCPCLKVMVFALPKTKETNRSWLKLL